MECHQIKELTIKVHPSFCLSHHWKVPLCMHQKRKILRSQLVFLFRWEISCLCVIGFVLKHRFFSGQIFFSDPIFPSLLSLGLFKIWNWESGTWGLMMIVSLIWYVILANILNKWGTERLNGVRRTVNTDLPHYDQYCLGVLHFFFTKTKANQFKAKHTSFFLHFFLLLSLSYSCSPPFPYLLIESRVEMVLFRMSLIPLCLGC